MQTFSSLNSAGSPDSMRRATLHLKQCGLTCFQAMRCSGMCLLGCAETNPESWWETLMKLRTPAWVCISLYRISAAWRLGRVQRSKWESLWINTNGIWVSQWFTLLRWSWKLVLAPEKDSASPIEQVTNESCWTYCVSHVWRCPN